jgi:hypothetical protein
MDMSKALNAIDKARAYQYKGAKGLRDYASAGGMSCAWNAGRIKGERLDCTVRALAICHASMTYADAHAHMRKHGRADMHGMKFRRIDDALTELGAKRIDTSERITVAQFAKRFARGIYYVSIRAHVFAMIDGRQVDMQATGIRTRVDGAWKFSD